MISSRFVVTVTADADERKAGLDDFPVVLRDAVDAMPVLAPCKPIEVELIDSVERSRTYLVRLCKACPSASFAFAVDAAVARAGVHVPREVVTSLPSNIQHRLRPDS